MIKWNREYQVLLNTSSYVDVIARDVKHCLRILKKNNISEWGMFLVKYPTRKRSGQIYVRKIKQ